jgi:hypothetical protein
MVIKVITGTNVKKNEPIHVESDTTLRAVLEEAGIDYTRGQINLDGSTLAPGDIDKSFDDFRITNRCFLLQTVKADNA